MGIPVTLIGVGLILAVWADVFRTLFYPAEKGVGSRVIAGVFWRGSRHPVARSVVGPITFLTVAALWFVLSATGWAFVYLPHVPDAFSFEAASPPYDAATSDAFFTALYFSLVTQTTVGYGDIVPVDVWLQLLAGLEAFSGLALLFCALSWYLSIVSTHTRRHSLAHKIALLGEAELRTGRAITQGDPEAAAQILDDLAMRLVAVRSDLLRYPITYYYRDRDERSALPALLPYLFWLAQEGTREGCPSEVILRAAVLRGAVEDFSATIASRFLKVSPSPVERVLEEYAEDHLRAQDSYSAS